MTNIAPRGIGPQNGEVRKQRSNPPIARTFDQWADGLQAEGEPPTDDCPITIGGDRLDSAEKVLAFLAEHRERQARDLDIEL